MHWRVVVAAAVSAVASQHGAADTLPAPWTRACNMKMMLQRLIAVRNLHMGLTLSLVYRDCKAPYRHDAFRRDKHHYMTTIDVQRAAAARLRAITRRSNWLRLVLACVVLVSLCLLSWPWELKLVIYRLALGGAVWVTLDQLGEFFVFRVELWRTSATAFLAKRQLRQATETTMRQLIVNRPPLPSVDHRRVRVRRALTL